jgi:hypothetical protein
MPVSLANGAEHSILGLPVVPIRIVFRLMLDGTLLVDEDRPEPSVHPVGERSHQFLVTQGMEHIGTVVPDTFQFHLHPYVLRIPTAIRETTR